MTGSSAHLGAGQWAYTIITQEIFEQYPHGLPSDPFQAFDNYVQFNAGQQASFPGPPTPPGQLPARAPAGQLAHQPGSTPDLLAITKAEADDQSRRQGSNSDEDDMTPAQSRRKAQNRAAYVAAQLLFPCTAVPAAGCMSWPTYLA